MKVAVIIPTYNEAQGIECVLDELFQMFERAPEHKWHIVVVDGNSPDDTAATVRKKQQTHPTLHLMSEPGKRGIACAYVRGIRYAIETLKVDAFAEFDGDGQHNPNDLLKLVVALGDADHVVGSRYIPGGDIPEEWALYRKFISRFGSLYARLLLELPVHDVTSGLKVTRVKGFGEHLPLQESALLSRHYAYKLQFLQIMVDLDARIKEVSIVFRKRPHDVSKNTIHDLFESFRVVALLRLARLQQWRLLKVILIGGFGFVLQTIVFEFLGIRTGLVAPSIAVIIGGEIAVLSNFFLNERFTFKDRAGRTFSLLSRITRFHLVSSGSIATQWLLLFIVERLITDPLFLRTAFVVGVLLGFLINYTGYYFYVWRERSSEK